MTLELPAEPDPETATSVAVELTRRLADGQLTDVEIKQATEWVHDLSARQAAEDAVTQQVVVVHETTLGSTYAFGPLEFPEALLEYEYWMKAAGWLPWVEVYIASLRGPERPDG